jgi:hypothetical protein
MSIEELRRGWNDATRARRRRPGRGETGGVRAGRERFSTFFLMRRVAISVEALQLLTSAPPTPFPLLALGLPENPYIRLRLVILWLRETTRCTLIFPSHGLRAQDLGRVGASETFVGVGVRLLR